MHPILVFVAVVRVFALTTPVNACATFVCVTSVIVLWKQHRNQVEELS